MRKIASIVLFLLYFVVFFSTMVYGTEQYPPKMVTITELPGEKLFNPIGTYIMTKQDIPLYYLADTHSVIIATLHRNKLAKVMAVETHTFPYKNKIMWKGKIVYLLMYRGEGRYSAWNNGAIQYIDIETNQIATNSKSWIRVIDPDTNLNGWINFNEYKLIAFYQAQFTGIFLNPEKGANKWQ